MFNVSGVQNRHDYEPNSQKAADNRQFGAGIDTADGYYLTYQSGRECLDANSIEISGQAGGRENLCGLS